MECARWRARKDRICLVRLPEFAGLEHDAEHRVSISLLIYKPQRVRVCPTSRGCYVSVWQVLP